MNMQQIEEARALATPVTHNITANDTCPAIVIQYVPEMGSASTNTASFTLANDSFQFLVNGATPSGVDVIGVSGKVDVSSSTYDTMGELVDHINGKQAWRAYLVGCLRSTTAVGLLAKTSTRCDNANGVTVYGDTSDYKDWFIAVSGEKFVNNGKNGHVTDWDDKVENALMYGNYSFASESNGVTLQYYTGKQGETETALTGTESIAESSTVTHGEENCDQPYIKATLGHRLIVKINQASSDIGTPSLNVTGRSAVYRANRVVNEKNYGDA